MRSVNAHTVTLKSTRGFTLLEVLIAMVITVSASAIVLTHIRTLMDFNIRIRQHQHQVTTTLNSAALFSSMAFKQLQTNIKPEHVDLLEYNSAKIIARVKNFSPTNAHTPPVDQAYTAYQLYRILPESKYPLSLLQPGLAPPK
jgi:prepilin-type N-terminal cleavage/methylation domain-containing protein